MPCQRCRIENPVGWSRTAAASARRTSVVDSGMNGSTLRPYSWESPMMIVPSGRGPNMTLAPTAMSSGALRATSSRTASAARIDANAS